MNNLLTVSSRHRDSILVLDLVGTIDAYNVRGFQSEARAFYQKDFEKVVLDCWGINYISSVGIGALVTLHREIIRLGGCMVLSGLKKSLQEVFSVLGMTAILAIAEDEEEAVERLNHPKTVFPSIVTCVICRKRLHAVASGVYRCPCCNTALAIDRHAQLRLR